MLLELVYLKQKLLLMLISDKQYCYLLFTLIGKIAHHAKELPPYVLLVEFFDSHDGGVILAAEPTAALAFAYCGSRLHLSRVQASLFAFGLHKFSRAKHG